MFKKFGFSGNSDFFKKLGEGIGKGLFILFAAIGTILLSVGSGYAGSFEFSTEWGKATGFGGCLSLFFWNPVSALFGGGLFFLLGAIGTYNDQNRQNLSMTKLEQENDLLERTKSLLNLTQEELQERSSRILDLHSELVKTWLKGASKSFNFDGNARVTIYYEHDEEFYLLARYSINPKYAKVHRQKFPLNQGVISKAWEHGKHKEEQCPHSSDYEEYSGYLEKAYEYTSDKINSLTMKSCRYYAKAISDADTHVGVIVFEGTELNFLSGGLEKSIDEYCQEHQGQLSKFVRDSLEFDKEINIKREGKKISVEDDLLRLMGGVS